MLLTIFTPTYNRASLLINLYNSLKAQTHFDFEWLIVDDGSVDDTKSIVEKFILENKINIKYIFQDNGGKHKAINTGLNHAITDYFFIVDSDDYLTDDAVQVIEDNLYKISEDSVCGLIFNRINKQGKTIGGENNFRELKCSLYDLKFKYHLNSDKAEVFKTKILRQFQYPIFENEKFSPEALVMYRMSGNYDIVYLNKGIYVGEYLEGGLTSSMTRIRMKSPKASTLYYKEHFYRARNLKEKIKCSINYFRFKANDKTIISEIPFPFSILEIVGYYFHKKDLKSLK